METDVKVSCILYFIRYECNSEMMNFRHICVSRSNSFFTKRDTEIGFLTIFEEGDSPYLNKYMLTLRSVVHVSYLWKI